jgi:hypothetical protein
MADELVWLYIPKFPKWGHPVPAPNGNRRVIQEMKIRVPRDKAEFLARTTRGAFIEGEGCPPQQGIVTVQGVLV